MEWKMYLSMIAFLTIMLSVFLIVACSVLVNVVAQFRQSRENQGFGINSEPASWRLPLFKAVPLAMLIAWLIVHFIITP